MEAFNNNLQIIKPFPCHKLPLRITWAKSGLIAEQEWLETDGEEINGWKKPFYCGFFNHHESVTAWYR